MAPSCEDLEEKLARLVAEFDQALAEKDEVMAEAEAGHGTEVPMAQGVWRVDAFCGLQLIFRGCEIDLNCRLGTG